MEAAPMGGYGCTGLFSGPRKAASGHARGGDGRCEHWVCDRRVSDCATRRKRGHEARSSDRAAPLHNAIQPQKAGGRRAVYTIRFPRHHARRAT